MKSIFSFRSKRTTTRVRNFLIAAGLVVALLSPAVAGAAPPFKAFSYAALAPLQNPGQGSIACQDVGVPLCPAGHVCKVFSYTGDAKGQPGFGKTNIEACISEDQNLSTPNAAAGTCSQSSGFAQITYQIKRKSQKVIVLGLVGQTCEVPGGAIPSLTQTMSLTEGPWAGNLSISSLEPDGSDALLSIYGTIKSGL